MNVYNSADVEGVAGIAGWNQILPGAEDHSVGHFYAILMLTRGIAE